METSGRRVGGMEDKQANRLGHTTAAAESFHWVTSQTSDVRGRGCGMGKTHTRALGHTTAAAERWFVPRYNPFGFRARVSAQSHATETFPQHVPKKSQHTRQTSVDDSSRPPKKETRPTGHLLGCSCLLPNMFPPQHPPHRPPSRPRIVSVTCEKYRGGFRNAIPCLKLVPPTNPSLL